MGSSPHARGARTGNRVRELVPGIIPACAGSTLLMSSDGLSPWDHPRMRGEHSVAGGTSCGHGGSSPHARGALPEALRDVGLDGIIPACAGSTVRRTFVLLSFEDHPRMRGEHYEATSCPCFSLGSSPHARGALSLRILGVHAFQGSSPHARGALFSPFNST